MRAILSLGRWTVYGQNIAWPDAFLAWLFSPIKLAVPLWVLVQKNGTMR